MPFHIRSGLIFSSSEDIKLKDLERTDFALKENEDNTYSVLKNRYGGLKGNILLPAMNQKETKKRLRLLKRMYFLSKKWY